MQKSFVVPFPVVIALLLGGCGGGSPTYESVAQEGIALYSEMADTLATIKDKATAEAAKAKLEALGERAKALKEKQEQLGDPSPEVKKKIMEQYGKQLGESAQKFMQQAMRLAMMPDVNEVLKGTMAKLKP